MAERQTRAERATWFAAVSLLAACGMALPAGSAYAAPAVVSPSCLTGGGASVHFLIGTPAGGSEPAISGLTITGLPGACNGSPMSITVLGNPAGDPTIDPTETLAVLDSTLAACSQAPLGHPPVVSGGSITLTGCPTGGPAAYASIHDATRLVIKVDGQVIDFEPNGPVASITPSPSPSTGTSTSPSSTASPSPSATPTATASTGGTGNSGDTPNGSARGSQTPGVDILGEKITRPSVSGGSSTYGILPFTGTWALLLFWLGVFILLAGIVLVVAFRRRNSYRPHHL